MVFHFFVDLFTNYNGALLVVCSTTSVTKTTLFGLRKSYNYDYTTTLQVLSNLVILRHNEVHTAPYS